ncbi:SCO1664 family protein [Streptomyces sp. N2-109]|uniref:SCO1664 family protein n=1 Tax=Streptomyces gossypii TaxID=2883101 RepID=A0ABT2JMY0_9ACTN|nr:SCO1664 family protein [Streptomyces gossypii]MCT2588730.1 SCO1664 family protein [Streptomyces gossypii]
MDTTDGAREPLEPHDVLAVLERGALSVRGQIREASNAVLFGEVEHEGRRLRCVYKPVAGERPLWDFPDGTLAQREVAAYAVSEATGWGLIPATVLREGPYGEGMCQRWIGPVPGEDPGGGEDPGDAGERSGETEGPGGAEGLEGADDGLLALIEAEEPGPGWKPVARADVGEGRTALLVHADDERLRRLAVLDAVINNGDRKGGHLLTDDGRLHAIDHGVTFHSDDRLRTLLWGWAGEPLTAEALGVLRGLTAGLAEQGALATRLGELITGAEVDAVRKRAAALLSSGRHPMPGGDWPPIPWPPV